LKAHEFVVYGEAQPAGSKRAFMRPGAKFPVVVDANPKAGEWKQFVQLAVGQQWDSRPPLEGPLFLAVYFYRPRPAGHYGSGRNADKIKDSAPIAPITRPDTTKLLRGVEDALTGIIWKDDAQVVAQVAVKLYGPAHVVIRIEEFSLEGSSLAGGAIPSDPAGVPAAAPAESV
jgi:Holliday junction resolvase RusA-like endonuclease